MICPSPNFIAIGRNPAIEPAQWPFRRLGVPALAIEARRAIDSEAGVVACDESAGRKATPKAPNHSGGRHGAGE